jgi:hypothetical protein
MLFGLVLRSSVSVFKVQVLDESTSVGGLLGLLCG